MQRFEEGKGVDVFVVGDGEMPADANDVLECTEQAEVVLRHVVQVQATHIRARAVVLEVSLGFDWSVWAGWGGQGAARVVEAVCAAHACDAV